MVCTCMEERRCVHIERRMLRMELPGKRKRRRHRRRSPAGNTKGGARPLCPSAMLMLLHISLHWFSLSGMLMRPSHCVSVKKNGSLLCELTQGLGDG